MECQLSSTKSKKKTLRLRVISAEGSYGSYLSNDHRGYSGYSSRNRDYDGERDTYSRGNDGGHSTYNRRNYQGRNSYSRVNDFSERDGTIGRDSIDGGETSGRDSTGREGINVRGSTGREDTIGRGDATNRTGKVNQGDVNGQAEPLPVEDDPKSKDEELYNEEDNYEVDLTTKYKVPSAFYQFYPDDLTIYLGDDYALEFYAEDYFDVYSA